MKKMTRSCSTISQRPASPKTKSYTVGTQPVRVAQDHRGIAKRQPSSPARSSFKTMAKVTSKADCYAQLKNLLPNARQSETTSELALVEESIAYIAHLESILSASNSQDQTVVSTMDLLKSMKF